MKLVLIGGGNYGVCSEKPYNLKEIDDKIFELAEKKHPRLLFIAFNEKGNYVYSFVKNRYIELGVQCEILRYKDFDNKKTVEGKFKRADIIYLGGGNTINYMNQIKKFGLDKFIIESANQNKIIAGISAGAIILSSFGSSDSRHYKDIEKFTKAKGLGLIDIVFVPHFSTSKRPDDLPRFMKTVKTKVVICADEQTAFVVLDNKFEIVKANEKFNLKTAFMQKSELVIKNIDKNGNLVDLIGKQ